MIQAVQQTQGDQIIVPVILCGGTGSRLWPMSRSQFPKQFISFGDDPKASLLSETVRRIRRKAHVARPVVMTNEAHRFLVAEHLRHSGYEQADIILEPAMRNTAPAITAAALYLRSRYKDALMLVLPSDHVIDDEAAFLEGEEKTAAAARAGRLVTFGITPEYAETGYGYIRQGKLLNGPLDGKGIHEIGAFVEKPDSSTAKSYLASSDYASNSGMFMFPVQEYLKEVEAHQPEIYTHVQTALEEGETSPDFTRLAAEPFESCPSVSVDYAVMEHTERGAVVPLSCGWSDAGAWDALWRIAEKDEQGNVIRGTIYQADTENAYLHQFQGGAPIATLGVEDVVVVSTGDMVLVTKKNRAQDVKKLMEIVAKDNRQLVEHHQRVSRPWGYYETIGLEERYQVKYIHVHPGGKLSLQMHHHRAEHWIITSGTARVQCDDEEMVLTEGQYVYIPLGSIHSIENIGKIGLDFIEVQHGTYLGEDDIIRLSDLYRRT